MPKDFRFRGDSSSGLPDRLLSHQMIFLILDSIWGFRCTRPMCWWIIKSCCNSQQLEFVEVEYIGRQAAAGSNIHKCVCELGMLWLIMHLHEEWICLKPFPEGNSFGRFATLCQIVDHVSASSQFSKYYNCLYLRWFPATPNCLVQCISDMNTSPGQQLQQNPPRSAAWIADGFLKWTVPACTPCFFGVPRDPCLSRHNSKASNSWIVSQGYIPVLPHKAVAEVSKIGNL